MTLKVLELTNENEDLKESNSTKDRLIANQVDAADTGTGTVDV